MERDLLIKVAYLVASVLFILGIKGLGRTTTARRGNTLSAIAMLIAIVATLLSRDILNFTEIFITVLLGSAIGVFTARKVEMTSMPEMVAVLNGFGGGASVLVASSEYWKLAQTEGVSMEVVMGITLVLSVIIGCVTFTGSFVAFGKLKGLISGRAIVFSGQHLLNAVIFLAILVLGALVIINPNAEVWMLGMLLLALLLGILTVIPIGGADMPVVISLLNSYSGIAAAATGFVLNNQVLIIAGALVGASGLILTQIMCRAMNRSLINVLLGGFGQTSSGGAAAGGDEIVVKEVGVEESAMLFESASSVIIVPGYGMAVAQAQHVVRELTDLLEKRGTSNLPFTR
ncbi:NAD(P) transhydrogenase subunit beta [Cesiribacter andamanensis AMV16]|uniref:proton-translocating NAD(P)(+) transhydrogenase n=1 Tax=Cesiribacter andamanensis AMV16 TaxID=1279009 RepID=M7NNH3_9BACT|nr:NAD(P)(+) transhydrogenase (Re/Si-specific) subunit beta [Cesiribacter andamanensis]EMR03255.1 NAD(P) transhydrogenase subunit beta [Cesiribacter andamanensis AMV16]